jgi:hypothetical protein
METADFLGPGSPARSPSPRQWDKQKLKDTAKLKVVPVPVAHACNPSYSGGRRISLKPAQQSSSRDPILKTTITKRAGRLAQGEGPEFKPQYHKKKFLKVVRGIKIQNA